jgi:Transcriptional regulator, AbiEi antitoxin
MREPVRITLEKRRKPGPVRLIAAGQHGVVARGQLLAAGVDGSAIDRALYAGKLHRVHRGVYATVAPELLTEEGRLLAALLGAGEGAVLSHGTAAWRWRIIPAPPSLMQLALPRDRAHIDGLTLFVSRNLRPGDVTANGRFPTTTVPRTLLDLATRYSHGALLRALAEAEFHHDLRPAEIERTLRRGHPEARTSAPRCTNTRPATGR